MVITGFQPISLLKSCVILYQLVCFPCASSVSLCISCWVRVLIIAYFFDCVYKINIIENNIANYLDIILYNYI